jgi:transcriptional regulator with XRE-family HTH domain
MTIPKEEWTNKVVELRKTLNLSQDDLAVKLETNQCTISRWERGITTPNYRMRAKLEKLHAAYAEKEEPETELIGIVAQELFDGGSLPSMLFRRDGTVMAISSGNEYQPGLKYKVGVTLADQTLPEDRDKLGALEAFLEETDFWNTVNTCFNYPYKSRGEDRCVVLTSVKIGSQTYCLMQKKSLL